MALTPFAQLELAARSDLESTIASYALIVQEDDTNLMEKRIEGAKADAKSELLTDLLQNAPDIFAYSQTICAGASYGNWTDWFFEMGYNWNSIDSLMDALFNPTVLKDTFVASWKWKLYAVQTEDMLSSGPDAVAPYERMRDYWEEQYHVRYDKAYKLLQFDLNGDGTIQPAERVRTRNVLRVR